LHNEVKLSFEFEPYLDKLVSRTLGVVPGRPSISKLKDVLDTKNKYKLCMISIYVTKAVK